MDDTLKSFEGLHDLCVQSASCCEDCPAVDLEDMLSEARTVADVWRSETTDVARSYVARSADIRPESCY